MAGLPKSMKALIKEEDVPSYILKDMDIPEPQDDEVLIKVEAASICGSDIPLYHYNDTAKAIAALPFIPGHEASGVVIKTGPKATIEIGKRIAVENHFFCGSCYQCKHVDRALCQNMGQYGHGKKTIHGGCSQYSIVSSKYCYELTTDIDATEAALLEPLGVSHNAVERLKVEGEAVLVIGCGPIGLLAIACCKAMGASRILAVDIQSNRLHLAKEMGADRLIDTTKENLVEAVLHETSRDGIGRIVECSGASQALNSVWLCARKGGRIVLVGLPKTPIHIEHPLPNFIFKSLTVKTIHGRSIYHTWQAIEHLVATKQVDVKKIVSHRLPLDQFELAFEELFSGKACKIVLYPNGII